MIDKSVPNAISAFGALLGVISTLMPWLSFRANRLVLGQPIGIGQLVGSGGWLALLGWVLVFSLSILKLQARVRGVLGAVILSLVVLFTGAHIGINTAALLHDTNTIARVSFASGVWLGLLGLYVTSFGLSTDWHFAGFIVLGALLLTVFLGDYQLLGFVLELNNVRESFVVEIVHHFALSSAAVLVAVIVGLPLGVLGARHAKLEGVILGGAGLLQTIPSLALFGVLLAPLAWLGRSVTVGTMLTLIGFGLLNTCLMARIRILILPRALIFFITLIGVVPIIAVALYSFLVGNFDQLSAWTRMTALLSSAGVRGIGAAPALIALVLYALLPVIVNTFVGLRNVPDSVRDAAKGMGMNTQQIFWRVEFPMATPFIFEGFRGALLLAFGLTTVAALIGGGGLGFFILRGVDANAPDLILLGAAPIVIIALMIDTIMRALAKMLTPKGLSS